jgi:quercetin dioxygenase-like cupin family protein
MADHPEVLNELEGVVALADLVQYQPGAVVSRTIVKKPSGTVTAFAFDLGEGLSEHMAAFDALVLMIEGACEVSISGVAHRLSAGQLLKLPASRPHALMALTRFKMLLVMVKE